MNTGALGGFGAFAAFVVETVGEVGSITPVAQAAIAKAADDAMSLAASAAAGTNYSAVGFAIEYTITQGTFTGSGWFLGIVGWNGINTSNNTVQELVVVGGGEEDGSTLPTSTSGTIESGDLFALYWDNPNEYFGTSGTGTITGSNFGSGGTDCSASQQGITVECSFVGGRMNGNFAFVATGEVGNYTQPAVQFSSLPAVKVTIAITQ
ncbi:MAG: hypothetical protein OER21_07635 [Gemmatimonadota bacterium]|nr:hypothetical protein [Gemmatimonadota bacterium]